MHLTYCSIRDHPDYWKWMVDQTGIGWCANSQGFVAIDADGTIMAGAVFDEWTKTSCCAHYAVANPMVLRHGYLQNAFTYVFEKCDRLMIIGKTASDLPKALRFNKHLGFTEVCRITDAFDTGVDLVLQQMRREDCRWIRRH